MSNPSEISIGEVRFDLSSLALRDAAGAQIPLRKKSSEVLACLARRTGAIVTKSEIISSVWQDIAVTDESLTQCISEIRKAVGDTGQKLITTHVGKGYCLVSAPVVAPTKPKTRLWAAALVAAMENA